MPWVSQTEDLFSPSVALVFIFNLIVGTGVLTLPAAIAKSGWLLGVIVILLLAFISYITATFIIESISAGNALLTAKKLKRKESDAVEGVDNYEAVEREVSDEQALLLENDNGRLCDDVSIERQRTDCYSLDDPLEMGQLACMFYNSWGLKAFYCLICLYLYGDLSIYLAAMAKSMRDVTCTYSPSNSTCNSTAISVDEICWPDFTVSRGHVYRIYVIVFFVLLCPFVFGAMQKTRFLQMVTTAFRWIAMTMMTVLALNHLSRNGIDNVEPVVHFAGLPNLFGVSIYSFMCHHSLPSIISPVKSKHKIFQLLAAVYLVVFVFYITLSLTGVFSFAYLYDLYTLNFQPNTCDGDDSITDIVFIQYFLALFPVFTLSTNFPIIAVTLRNNIRSLIIKSGNDISDSLMSAILNSLIVPILTVLVPALMALSTENIQFLVGVTGSYAGSGVQYLIPATLVMLARKRVLVEFGPGLKNRYSSPFKHPLWIIAVFFWTALCLCLVTSDYFVRH